MSEANESTERLLETAAEAVWRRVRIRPGEFAGGEEASWRIYAELASEEDKSLACAALQRLIEHGFGDPYFGKNEADIDYGDVHLNQMLESYLEPSISESVLMWAEDEKWPMLPLAGLKPCETPEKAWRAYVANSTCIEDLLDAKDALLEDMIGSQQRKSV